jgi:hypothetical protein
MAEKEIQEVSRQDGSVKKHRRFDDRDWKYLAEFVIQEYEKRRNSDKRKERERQWKEIDRQIEMRPDIEFKKMPNGAIDVRKAWMAEMELPLQAQALEVLTADARRLMFPDSGPWFRAHAEMTDEYLDKVNFQSLIHGDDNEMPSHINQDNADKLAEAFLLHLFRQYDHVSKFDMINAETFKYGMGIGRARMERKSIYLNESKGVRRENQLIPTIVPVSIKGLYPDDPKPSMHSSQVLGPAHIAHEFIRYENLALAASKGSTDPENDDGGWMPDQLRKVVPDKDGYVQVLEMEGDIIVPRKTVRSVVIPGAILTVALGGKEKSDGAASRAVIRFRFRKYPFSSYLFFPYHYEGADDFYPTSPLMKGRTIQMAATDALNRLMDSGALKNSPPVGYDHNNLTFTQAGGAEIYPGAQWETADPVTVYNQIGGDPGALAGVLAQHINLYAELTGVLPSRLGAQTVSHTTAYSKQAELQRGATRTVDYVNQCGKGPIERWLDMAYRMGRDAMGKKDTSFWIEAYGGYVSVSKEQLPEDVMWEWFGAGGPQENQAKMQAKMQALQAALQMDAMAIKTGRKPTLNMSGSIKETLREGGWTDLDSIVTPEGVAGGPQAAPALPAPAQGGGPAALKALQDLSGAGS